MMESHWDSLREAVTFSVNVEADDDLGSHFKVTYDNGQVAEVSWSFVQELLVKK